MYCCCCSVDKLCLTLCDPIDCSTLGFPVHHHLLEFAQTHVHWIGGAIQPSHLLLSPSHLAFNISQYQGLFQGVSSSRQLAKVLEHTRLSCTPLSPGVCSNSRPLSWWCHPTISSSVVPFSSCPQSLPPSGSFLMSQFFASGGQSIGVSALASVLQMNIQD